MVAVLNAGAPALRDGDDAALGSFRNFWTMRSIFDQQRQRAKIRGVYVMETTGEKA